MLACCAMRRPEVAVSVATALLLAALFAGDSVWTAIAALAVAGGWSALALVGRASLPRRGYLLLGLLLATAVWSGLSIAWSIAPDRSWAELDRTLVFAAFLVVGLLLGASGPAACRRAAAALRDRSRRRGCLGAGGEGHPGPLPGRRPRRPVARPDRLLERARARRGHPARARSAARGRRRQVAGIAGRRRRARLRRNRGGAAGRLTCRRCSGGSRRRRSGSGFAATGWRPRSSHSSPSCREGS